MKKILSLILSLVLALSLVATLNVSAEELPIPDKSTWKITANTEISWGKAAFMIDGKTDTIWHSKYDTVDKKAVNKVQPPYIFDITLPSVATTVGMRFTPRQNSDTGYVKGYEIYVLEGETQGKLLAKGNFKGDETIEMVAWEETNLSGIRFIITSTAVAGGAGTCAEIDLIGPAEMASANDAAKLPFSEPIPEKSTWTITANTEIHWGKAAFMIDGNSDTYWHTNYKATGSTITSKDEPPFYVTIDFPGTVTIAGFTYTPRQDNIKAGRIFKYKSYAILNGEEYFISEGEWANDMGLKSSSWSFNVKLDSLKLEFLDGSGGYGTCAELNVIPYNSNMAVLEPKEYAAAYEAGGLIAIPKKGMVAKCDAPLQWPDTGKVSCVIDGSTQSVWQTTKVEGPYVLDIDLNGEYYVAQINVLPRQSSDWHGLWLDFDVLYSVDGVNYETAKDLLSFEKKSGEQIILFDEPITAKYFRFYINMGNDGRASCAEITFYESTTSAGERAEAEKESYVLKIGSNEIKSNKGGIEKTTTIDVAPYIAGAGYTLIPLRGLLEEMGATIEWNGDIQQIIVEKEGTFIEMQIMYRSVYIVDPKGKEVRYTLNEPPRIKDSRTFIPLRFISEQLGYKVEWNGETQEITITK